MHALFSALPPMEKGSVWLVGAGPGDPGLLTLHAANALQQADVIVHDALVNADCLSLARPGAMLEFAGKRGGKPSHKQRDISLRLVELARAGHRVLRLKGGDPFVFGRGGEEALTLIEHGIPFRIVPGITAGIVGRADARAPAAHPGGQPPPPLLPPPPSSRINWEGIAKGSPVIVMYMAMKHIGQIAANLIAGGRSPDEPVAFVCNAATAEQAVLETTLSRAEADVTAAGIEPPAIVVVGEVVRLRASLDWLGALKEGRRLSPDPFGTRERKDPA